MIKGIALYLTVVLISPLAWGFSGGSATEAAMHMKHFVDIPRESYDPTKVSEEIEYQILHMYGPMAYRPAEAPAMAADKGDGDFQMLSLENLGEVVRAHYTYSTTLVLQNGPEEQYRFALPRTPKLAFSKSNSFTKNPCTDEHYKSEGDFWYFWSPSRKDCGDILIEGIDYDWVTAEIERKPNVESSYPEYERLPDANKKIKIYLIMGMDKPTNNRNPLQKTKQDANADNYAKIREAVTELGRKARQPTPWVVTRWDNKRLNTVIEEDTRPFPYVESLVLSLPDTNTRAREIELVMFFGKTGIDEASKGFHYFLRHAFAEGGVVIYDGHSGLGGNLNLPHIEEMRTETSGMPFAFDVPKDRYQIFYFNSCSSYTYYNAMFFNLKKTRTRAGSKNLDIVTTGLETAFDGSVRTNMELIRTIYNWAHGGTVKSYQNLVSHLENENLAGINGDEDNPTEQFPEK